MAENGASGMALAICVWPALRVNYIALRLSVATDDTRRYNLL